MKKFSTNRSKVVLAAALFGVFSLLAFPSRSQVKEGAKREVSRPSITLTSVPTSNLAVGSEDTDDISGVVAGVDPSDYKVVLYAYTDKWWIQPLANAFFTDIGVGDNKFAFEAKTHSGTEYAALLVKAGSKFKFPATTSTLPNVGGDIVAVHKLKPKKQAEK